MEDRRSLRLGTRMSWIANRPIGVIPLRVGEVTGHLDTLTGGLENAVDGPKYAHMARS